MPVAADTGTRVRYLLALLMCGLALQGCFLFARHYTAAPQPLRPTIVGVVAAIRSDATGYPTMLVDGRVVDQLTNGTYRLLGGGDTPGDLLLAGTNNGGFSAGLSPIAGTDCWEAWSAPSSHPIVWDMGDSIMFMDGIELPKAPGYHVDLQPQMVDGRLAWAVPEGDVAPQWMSFCANDKGEIVSGKLP